MDNNAADDQKPHYNGDGLAQVPQVLAALVLDQSVDKLNGDVEIKHGGHADGAEEADEEGVAGMLDLRDELVHGVDPGEAPEKEDEDAQERETIKGDGTVGEKGRPWAHSTEPEED